MGSVCCCLHVPDEAEPEGSNGSNNGSCICPRCLIFNFMNKYGSPSGRGGRGPVPSSVPVATSSSTTVAPINSSEINRVHDRVLPNISIRSESQVQQDVIVVRQEKGSSHSRIEPEPGRDADFQVAPELLKEGDNCAKEGPKVSCSKTSVKVMPLKEESGPVYALSSFEDEDVCPTCLEEYTLENPKIIAKCSHHYHLSCIYEWMERSETCPICGKLMMFDETS